MPYYDSLIDDPQSALDQAAQRRGESRQGMATRLEQIRSLASAEQHLTLRQARNFIEHQERVPEHLAAHVETCGYCRALTDGLAEQAIDDSLASLQRRLQSDPQGLPDDAITPPEPASLVEETATATSPRALYGFVAGVAVAALGLVGFQALTPGVLVATPRLATDNVSINENDPTWTVVDSADGLVVFDDENREKLLMMLDAIRSAERSAYAIAEVEDVTAAATLIRVQDISASLTVRSDDAAPDDSPDGVNAPDSEAGGANQSEDAVDAQQPPQR